MAINPYTLYGLYEKGILDYVPSELMMPTPSAAMTPMSNPYLDMAKQGGLYQKYGSGDSYTFSGSQNNMNLQNTEIGSQSSAASNAYGLSGIGYNSNAANNAYGLQGIGTHSMAAANANGLQGIGSQAQNKGLNAWGGIKDVSDRAQNSINTAASIYERTPRFIKGIISALIIGGTALLLLKRGKKPQNTNAGNNKSFLSKLNPVNWYKALKAKFTK